MELSTFAPLGRHARRLTAVAAVTALAPVAALAQDCTPDEWPCDTVEVVSHSSAGGGTDTTIRMWMEEARDNLDEDIRVVYKQGGGARSAHEYLVSRGPDGHTIFALTQTHLYTIARGNSPVEIDQLQGVARAMDDPSVIVVRGDSDIADYDALIAASQDQALTWGVAQVGGTEHIGISRWAGAADAEVRVVPFGGGGDMITSLRSGAVDAALANISEALPQIQEGDLRALGAAGFRPIGTEAIEDGHHPLGGVALVDKERHVELAGQLDLASEPGLLGRARREVAVEVEAALTDRDDGRTASQPSQSGECGLITARGVVGMHPRSAPQGAGPGGRQRRQEEEREERKRCVAELREVEQVGETSLRSKTRIEGSL